VSGSYTLKDSTIRSIAFGTPHYNLANASVLISGNRYEDTLLALDAADLMDSGVEFSYNKVNSVIGFNPWNSLIPEDLRSTFLIKNNVFQGAVGLAFEQTFGEGNTCLIKGNDVQKVTDVGIYLGPGTTGCTVIGGNNKTNVLDLGTGNTLIGVNNMGTGVGPTIRHFLKNK
jgi:hypothetical protein